MRRITATVTAALLSALTVASLAVIGAPGAQASSVCMFGGTKTSTSTTGYVGGCDQVQARIDRYSGGIWTYTGSWSTSQSFVSSTLGVNAGNAVRGRAGATTSSWSWI